MRISIIPPEYFPRQQIVALALLSERMVLADTFPFERRSYQNRTKIRTPQGWHWARIPTFGKQRGKAIREVEIEDRERWITKHWRSLQFNYRSTPYFELYEPRIENFFETDWSLLGEATCLSMEKTLGLLDYEERLVRASDLPECPDTFSSIIKSFGEEVDEVLTDAEQYVPDSAPAGLKRLSYEEFEYEQNFDGYEPGMTALDLIFNYGPEAIQMMKEASAVVPAEEGVASE